MTTDIRGNVSFGMDFSNSNFATTLAAGVAQSVTVPDDAQVYQAIIANETGTTVFCARNTTATLPSGSFAATSSQMLPQSRRVYAGDTLSFITNDTSAYVSVSFYAGVI